MKSVQDSPNITLGILAGGRASRLGGLDKAWLERNGVAQVVLLAETFSEQVDAVIVSANRSAERYLSHGLRAIHDRVPDLGPLGGLEALVAACRSDWLLTLPVDATHIPDGLLDTLVAASGLGAYAVDDDGPQPLVALWPVAAARVAIAEAMDKKDFAIHAVQSRLGMPAQRFDGIRFGNLNTPEQLAAAGIPLP